MTITVTMLQTRRGEGGATWTVGNSYSATDSFGAYLITSNLATGTIPLPDASSLTSAQAAAVQSLVSGAGIVGSATYSAAQATANTALINAALASYGNITVQNPGSTIWLDPLVSIVMPSQSCMTLFPGVKMLSGPGRICPVVKNKYCGIVITGADLVRAANVVTVSEAGHTKAVGDLVWVGLQSTSGTDSSFFGLVTVTAAVKSVSWSYASTGSNGAAGASTVFYALIPVRQTLAGSSFSATANYVTVTEPGHNKRPGMQVWLGQVGGSNFAPGVVTVTRASPTVWVYKTAAATGTGTGTIALSFDTDIEIDGPLASIDGNRLNCGVVAPGSDMQYNVSNFGVVTVLRINTSLRGSAIRSVNAFNCASVILDNGFSGSDTLVVAQFEGGARGVVVDQVQPSEAMFKTDAAQQSDDYLAFSGTACVGGVGNYDAFTSPYGLTSFSGLDVRSLVGVNALNGIKLTATGALCPFLGTIKIGRCEMANLNNLPLIGTASFMKIFDDGPGLVATAIDTIDLQGPFSWNSAPVAGSAGLISVTGTGTIKALLLRGMNADGSNLSCVDVSGGTIDLLLLDASKLTYSLITNAIHFNLQGGTVKKLKVRDSRIEVGATNAYSIYLNGSTVKEIELEDCQIYPQTAGAGQVIYYGVAAGLDKITLKGVKTETTAGTLSTVLSIADIAVGTLDISAQDCNINSASFITTPGGANTGTVNVYLTGPVKWTPTGGGNFMQTGGSGAAYNVFGGDGVVIPDDKMALFAFGTPTYRLSVASQTARVNMNSGNYVGAQMAPVAGDILYNANAGALIVGKVIRRAAAWAML